MTKIPLATTWLISFEQIRVRDSLATNYFCFMSYIDPEAIPQSLLPPPQPMKKVVDAIGMLSAYSFITIRLADQSFDLHRLVLVHLATRNWLRQQGSLAVLVAKVVARLGENFPNSNIGSASSIEEATQSCPRSRTPTPFVRPHSRPMDRNLFLTTQYIHTSELLGKGLKGSVVLLQISGLCLLSDGRWNEAEGSFMQIMEVRKTLGQKHSSMLTSIVNLVSTCRNQERLKEAEELEVHVMESRNSTRSGVSRHTDWYD